jgi:hypothetical protein
MILGYKGNNMNTRINNNSYKTVIESGAISITLANSNRPFIEALILEFKARFVDVCKVNEESNNQVVFVAMSSVSDIEIKNVVDGFIQRFNSEIDADKLTPQFNKAKPTESQNHPDYNKANSICDNLGMISIFVYCCFIALLGFAGFTHNLPLAGWAIGGLISSSVMLGNAKANALTAKYAVMTYAKKH